MGRKLFPSGADSTSLRERYGSAVQIAQHHYETEEREEQMINPGQVAVMSTGEMLPGTSFREKNEKLKKQEKGEQ